MKKALFALGICAIPLLAWLAFGRAPNQIYLSGDTAAVRQEILRVVPLQGDINQAKVEMERQGFTCTWAKNQQFATFNKRRQLTHSKADFLYCNKERGWMVQERWQIVILHQNNRVTEVHVSYGLTGP